MREAQLTTTTRKMEFLEQVCAGGKGGGSARNGEKAAFGKKGKVEGGEQ